MSAYYELYCPRCREICNAASAQLSGANHLIDSDEVLPPFIVWHAACPLKVIPEFDDEFSHQGVTRWNRMNMRELYRRPMPTRVDEGSATT